MNTDYRAALDLLRDARKKRGKKTLTKKFFDRLRVINRDLPPFAHTQTVLNIHASNSLADDAYSNELLRSQGHDYGEGRIAKTIFICRVQ